MYILRAVKLRRTAGTDAVCAEGLDSLFFDSFVSDEVVEVVGCEVRYGPAVGEFSFRS